MLVLCRLFTAPLRVHRCNRSQYSTIYDYGAITGEVCTSVLFHFNAGLKALASTAGYHTASIQSSSQFKRTHNFILEVWEAVYRVMLTQFAYSRDLQGDSSLESLPDDISNYLQFIPNENFSQMFNQQLQAHSDSFLNHFDVFKPFIRTRAQEDDTWRFWVQFVFPDAMAYVGLFLAIRSGNW